jgi:undecaprenyl diphosphate synthase
MVNIAELFNIKEAITISSKRMPKHVAVSFEPTEQFEESYNLVRRIATVGFKCKIPVLTFMVLAERMRDSEHYNEMVDAVESFFEGLSGWEYLSKHQVKVTVLGKWYNLPGRVVECVKTVLDETGDFDQFFLNLCVNYDGQEEIVDACKLIGRQVKADKLDPESVGKDMMKENIYSSYFIPPSLIIKTGRPATSGLLLWDSGDSIFYFTNKPWSEFTKADFLRGVEFYQKHYNIGESSQ